MDFSIHQWNAKADFNYFLNSKHTVTAGACLIRYDLSPGRIVPNGDESLLVPDSIQHEQSIEASVYIGDNYEITPRLSVYGGLRYSHYQSLGARNVIIQFA